MAPKSAALKSTNGYTYGSLPTHDPYGPGGRDDGLAPLEVGDISDKRRRSALCGKWALAGAAGLSLAALGIWRRILLSGGGGGAPGPSKPKAAGVKGAAAAPLSALSPEDLGLKAVERTRGNSPGMVWGRWLKKREGKKYPLPTNAWYLNLLTQNAGEHSTEANQAYTVPYIVDTVGAITGLRVHWPIMSASYKNMQMVYDATNGLTMGTSDPDVSKQYRVDEDEDLSLLGVSLKWANKGTKSMTTHIVRGMPYATMRYDRVTPSFAGGDAVASPPLVDGKVKLECGDILKNGGYSDSPTVRASREVQLHFKSSDFTWIVFFSRPVTLQCAVAKPMGPGVIADTMFQMRVVDDDATAAEDAGPLFVRSALLNQCTTGRSDIHGHCKENARWKDQAGYLQILREGARLYSKTPRLEIDFSSDGSSDDTRVTFDWDAQTIGASNASETVGGTNASEGEKSGPELLMFALPHHQSALESREGTSSNEVTHHCIATFHGSTCLVRGAKWSLSEEPMDPLTFSAPRPPEASAIPDLARAVASDIQVRPSDNLYRGASDTYFSGKILARIGRVILIASELKRLAEAAGGSSAENSSEGLRRLARSGASEDDYEGMGDPDRLSLSAEAAGKAALPSDDEVDDAISSLRRAVDVWLNGTSEAPFVYDKTWGGLVNCGCDYKGKGEHGKCVNKFPECPALVDVNKDFGNGFYMDHHFHYGYHIYAAAVVARYDPQWAISRFDRILLLVRDIANPSPDDPSFPPFRHKDWYLGSSWASGLISAGIPVPPHGRNQESSSEAIAAYEAVALFGEVMMDAFGNAKDSVGSRVNDARRIRDVGRLLTAMEVKAANRYWHVWNSTTHVNTYPPEYKQPVVGMLHETMASFQTWFGPEDFASYGIQLLPFTAVAERRDDPEWAKILYPKYKKSCLSEKSFCVDNGWTILLSGLRATAGERKEALDDALSVPDKVFRTEGACGHSLTNTIWYIATRPDVAGDDKNGASSTSSEHAGAADAVDISSAVADAVRIP